MSEASPRHPLQQRVASAILDGATRVFARHGDQASMNDIAEAAGVARATVYRYFPNREVLLDELAQVAISELGGRLSSARIDEVTPEEGIGRIIRALVDLGDSVVLLTRVRSRTDSERFECTLAKPLGQVFERGQACGGIRDDIPAIRLSDSLIGLIVGVLTSTPPLGKEDATATITRLFLDGALARGPRPV